jgi:hypothetical protein
MRGLISLASSGNRASAEATERRAPDRERAAIGFGEIRNDREAQSRTGLGFVESTSAGENGPNLAVRDARPVVLYQKRHGPILFAAGNPYP